MFAGAFALFLLFAAAVQWMVKSGDRTAFDEEALRAKQRYEILGKVNAENAGLISGYAWADQAKGAVRIPLSRAMELTVARLAAQGEPRPAGPIDPVTSQGSALKPGGFAAPQPTPPPFAPAATPAPAPEEPPAEPAPATQEEAP
jgi:hypothetical protein